MNSSPKAASQLCLLDGEVQARSLSLLFSRTEASSTFITWPGFMTDRSVLSRHCGIPAKTQHQAKNSPSNFIVLYSSD